MPPEKVLLLATMTVPLPFWTTEPAPLMTPPTVKVPVRSKSRVVPAPSETEPLPREPLPPPAPTCSTPLFTTVPPPYALAPLKTHVPVPSLTSRPPPVSADASVLVSAVLPDNVSLPPWTTTPGLVKLSAPTPPEPAGSIVPPLPRTVNRRSMLATAPVYCNVPPLNTRLDAALLDAP